MSLSAQQAGAATPAPPAAPALPQPPATRATALVPGPDGTVQKLTLDDIAALRARKEELSRLLNSAHGRRKEVQNELRGATGADKAGLEQRIGVLDGRIARLEQEIDENSSQLASLDAMRLATTSQPGRAGRGRYQGGSDFPGEVVALLVMFPLALAFARNIWKRGSRPAPAVASADTTQRLERMEQAMDAIAIEIERVSEGQRFVTRLMAEGRAGALGAGGPAMEPLPVPDASYIERR